MIPTEETIGYGWLISYKFYIYEYNNAVSSGYGEHYVHTSKDRLTREDIDYVKSKILENNTCYTVHPTSFKFSIVAVNNLGQMSHEEILGC